ncbi:MAG: helix-turn-helix transcriptional regulator [Bacteroidota bacterium]
MSQRIRHLRETRNFNQKEIASLLKISQGTYSGIENGTVKPSLDKLQLLSSHYQVSIDWIVNGNEEFHTNYSSYVDPNEKVDTVRESDHATKYAQGIEEIWDEIKFLKKVFTNYIDNGKASI